MKGYIKRRLSPTKRRFEAVMIGVSAGGMKALSAIIPLLPKDFILPLVVVQHLHPYADDYLVRYLNEKGQLMVKYAEEKEKIVSGVVYLAPPNYHLLIEDDKTFSFSTEGPVNYARPSIDVLFESAANVYGTGLIGIILTGANYDGSQGLKRIKEMGGLTIVQDPRTAEMDSMPKAAIASTKVDHILPLDQIGLFLAGLFHEAA